MATKKQDLPNEKKRAVAISIVCISICLVLLISVTVAWFSGLSTSSENKITSGNIGLEMYVETFTYNESTQQFDLDANSRVRIDAQDANGDMHKIFDGDDTANDATKALKWVPGQQVKKRLVVKNTTDTEIEYQLAFSEKSTNLGEAIILEAAEVSNDNDFSSQPVTPNGFSDVAFLKGKSLAMLSSMVANPANAQKAKAGHENYYDLTFALNKTSGDIYQGQTDLLFDVSVVSGSDSGHIHMVRSQEDWDALFKADGSLETASALKEGDTVIMLTSLDKTVKVATNVVFNLNLQGNTLKCDLFTMTSATTTALTADIGAFSKGTLDVPANKIGFNAPTCAFRYGYQEGDTVPPTGDTYPKFDASNANALCVNRLNGSTTIDDVSSGGKIDITDNSFALPTA